MRERQECRPGEQEGQQEPMRALQLRSQQERRQPGRVRNRS
jgi:hypothetical protein